MHMTSHVIYDEKTGEVVHVHFEPTGQRTTADEVMQHAGPAGDRALAVLTLDGPLPTTSFRVKNDELVEVHEDLGVAAGAAASGFAEPDTERRYERVGG
jgi:hypothetical protein